MGDDLYRFLPSLRLGTSPGLRRVPMSILVGILADNVTHGSGSPAAEDLGVVFVEVGTCHGYLLFTHQNVQ